ncbi:MAG: protein-export chaperone SecB [Pseudomonadota bacterium]
MSEQNLAHNTANPAAPHLPVMVHAQYVKDISFENPSAPMSLKAGQEPPKVDININLDAKPITDAQVKSLYEVAIRLSVKATRGDETLYIAEVLYAAAVSMPQIQEEHHHPLLLVEIPKMIFPFARKVLADLVQDGGYPALLLGPVDFASMYLSRFGAAETPTEAVA